MESNTEDKMRRIAIVAHDCGLRGAERVIVEEATFLVSKGWDVTVFVPCENGDLANFLRKKSVRVVTVRYYWWMGPGRILGRLRRLLGNLIALPGLIRFFRSRDFDIVHSHSIACGIGAVAARLAGIPHIWHLHESGPFGISQDRSVFDLGTRIAILLARWSRSRFVAVSRTVARLYESRFGLPEVSVLYQTVTIDLTVAAVDSEPLEKITSWYGPKLIIVGALVPLKDQGTAVRAMAEIIKTWPDARLYLLGDDPIGMGNEIDALARERGVVGNVVRLGTMVNAAPAIAAADGCIVTALDEGFGRVAVEAMLSETPVISADVAVNREVAGDGNIDFFAPSDPDALAAAVTALFSRPEAERRYRVEQAVAYAGSLFGVEVVDDALETELLGCLQPTCGRPG